MKLKISETSNLQLKIRVFTMFDCGFHFSVYFQVNRIALE